jgi:phosphate ABC transporter permease protein PstC
MASLPKLAAIITGLTLALIVCFLLVEGAPALLDKGATHFLLGWRWDPRAEEFGMLSMLAGTLGVTAGALLVGAPLGLACALLLSEILTPAAAAVSKPAVELLGAIPSVVYGFLGLVTLVPLIRTGFGGPGFSALAASLVVGVMILPTVTLIAHAALSAIPRGYREASRALGAGQWQTMRLILLPAARPGIVAGLILAAGRAVGETMAVLMVAGNALQPATHPLDPVRTLTATMALELGYATGRHRGALFTAGVVLLALSLAVTGLARLAGRPRAGEPD